MVALTAKKSTLILLILIVAGFTGNFFNLSLFFGVDFLFGSIAVLIAVRLFGTGWGTLTAVIASSYTCWLWNHPYAAIVLVCEALCVGLLLQRQFKNLVLLDGIYWVFVGMPLVWLFYSGFLHVDTPQTVLAMFKQGVNGICNALVANLLITYLPLYKWAKRPQIKKTLSLQQTLLNLLVAFVLFPVLMLMGLDAHRVMSNIESKIRTEIESTATDIVTDLQAWHQHRLYALNEMAQIAASSDIMRSSSADAGRSNQLQQSTELLVRAFQDFHNLYIVNASGNIVAAYPITNKEGQSTLGMDVTTTLSFKETKAKLQPLLSNVYVDPASRIPQVGLSVPVMVDNKFGGLAYVSWELGYIKKRLNSLIKGQRLQITLLDDTGKIVASTEKERVGMQEFVRAKGGEIQREPGDLYHWLPESGNLPPMVRWKRSFYVQETSLGGNIPWTLIVEAPVAPHISYLQNIYIQDLGLVFVLSLLALIVAEIMSSRLVSPLQGLARVTNNLPDKLLERESISWPRSLVTEIDFLVENFKVMAIALNQKFQELNAANEMLEQRVAERTEKLLKANKNLTNQIKERKRAEKALRRSEELYRTLARNFPNGAVILFDENLRYTLADGSGLAAVNLSRELLEGKTIWEVFPPETCETIEPIYRAALAGEATITEVPYSDRTYLMYTLPVRNEQGEISAGMVMTQDITSLKQAEAEIRTLNAELEQRVIERTAQLEATNKIKDELLVRSQQAEEVLRQQAEALAAANRMKDEFLAIVSHELRTPLNSILGWAKLLAQRKFDEATTARALETIERNAKAQAQLIDDILDISRIIRGKIRLNIRPINLANTIEAAIDAVRPTAEAKDIQLEVAIDTEVGLVSADAERLQQVIWNLLSNAIKFTPGGGRVSVRLARGSGELGGRPDAEITVSDTGKGIGADFLPYVFEQFRQADSSITRAHGGLGLGLAIVRQLVEMHSGTVEADSDGEGKGATFMVKLPLLEESREEEEPDYQNPLSEISNTHSLEGFRVLVVEDEADAREFCIAALEQCKAEVRAAASAAEALEMLAGFMPDVLVSDIGMPEEDGYSLMRKVRAMETEGRQIPAIALTAYTREEDRQQALLAGFQMHVSKPVEPENLVAAIANVTGKSGESSSGQPARVEAR